MVGTRRYRDSLPTVPTPEVLEQRLVEEFEARERADVATRTVDDPATPIAADVDVDIDVAVDAPPSIPEALMFPVETPHSRGGVEVPEPSVVIREFSVAIEALDAVEDDIRAEPTRDSRTSDTVPAVRIKRRRRRLLPRLLTLGLLCGALGAGYSYAPDTYRNGWQELSHGVTLAQRMAQQKWLDGRRSLGF